VFRRLGSAPMGAVEEELVTCCCIHRMFS
jgi:hypothetical protein